MMKIFDTAKKHKIENEIVHHQHIRLFGKVAIEVPYSLMFLAGSLIIHLQIDGQSPTD